MTTEIASGMKQMESAECAPEISIAEMLRLLGAGATGAILMALEQEALRTKALTERVPGYAPRTVYRYAGRLTELGVIEREERAGVPSKVVHALTDPCGSDLSELLDRFAKVAMTRLPDGRVDAHSWASLSLLADLWEAGIVEELAGAAKTPTELAQGPHGLSYHQVNRRIGLFKTAGFVYEPEGPPRRRLYALTEKTRKAMGLIAGLGCWRHRHVVVEGEEGLTQAEMTTVLKAALPLATIPEHAGKCLQIQVVGPNEGPGAEGESIWGTVQADGTLRSCAGVTPRVDGWVRGKVECWIPLLLEGRRPRGVVSGGDERLASDCLSALHAALWAPSPA